MTVSNSVVSGNVHGLDSAGTGATLNAANNVVSNHTQFAFLAHPSATFKSGQNNVLTNNNGGVIQTSGAITSGGMFY